MRKKKIEVSKDIQAELFLGLRLNGKPHIALFMPEELGYVCPICGLGNTFCDGELTWSEYKALIYCPRCNIDIPSCFCIKYSEPKIGQKPLNERERIERAKEIFYETCKSIIKRYNDLTKLKGKPNDRT